jgi:hypothetical protein
MVSIRGITGALVAAALATALAQAPAVSQFTTLTTCTTSRAFQSWTAGPSSQSQLIATVGGVQYCLDVPVWDEMWMARVSSDLAASVACSRPSRGLTVCCKGRP